MLLSSILLVPINAHSQLVGQVSINGGTEVVVPSTQTTISVPIELLGSDAMNGFSIQVKTDPTILNPTSVSLGGLLVKPTIITECINGVIVVTNTSPCPTQAGLGVVAFAAGSVGNLTSPPTSGILFNINYNVVSLTPLTSISFNTGCSGTSVSGDCVCISNGTLTCITETDVGATFSNQVDFSITPVFATVSTPKGVSINDTINYATIGTFSDLIIESVISSNGLICSTVNGFADLTTSPTASDILTCNSGTNGVYSATVTATGHNTGTTHMKTVTVVVEPVGFTISLSQSSVQVSRGNRDSSTMIKVSGFSSFSGIVSFTSPPGGVTGTAPNAIVTHDGSGFGTASSTLTISVGSSVTAGNYTLTVTGTSGPLQSTASLNVSVPNQDFSIVPIPSVEIIIRGGSVVDTLLLTSLGNFAGTVTLTATIANVNFDSCCNTTNITPAFTQTMPVLTAGTALSIGFFAGTVGGNAPPATWTATGNYTATITASSGTLSHTITIAFNIQDFTIGPAYCPGSNFVFGTPDGNQYPVNIGTPCNSLTITDQFNPLFPYIMGLTLAPTGQVLWVQSNALSGLQTNGFNGTPAIAAVNAEIDANGVFVPQLANFWSGLTNKGGQPVVTNFCLLPTFWPNGTQIPYSYLATHGPIISPGQGFYDFLAAINIGLPGQLGNWGCKFDAGVFPNDQGIPALNALLGTNFPQYNNLDFFAVTAQSLVGTLPGTYGFQLCGQLGVLRHCNMYQLNVLASPVAHQIVYSHTVSCPTTPAGTCASGTESFKMGVTNRDLTHTIYAQVTIFAVGNMGDTLMASTSVTIAPNTSDNNIALSFDLTGVSAHESFVFSVTMSVGTDPANLDGTSTETNGVYLSATFTVT